MRARSKRKGSRVAGWTHPDEALTNTRLSPSSAPVPSPRAASSLSPRVFSPAFPVAAKVTLELVFRGGVPADNGVPTDGGEFLLEAGDTPLSFCSGVLSDSGDFLLDAGDTPLLLVGI